MSETPRRWLGGVGLCSICRFAAQQESARGSRFWRCLRAEHEPARYLRYPPLPVNDCRGFEALPGPPGDAS